MNKIAVSTTRTASVNKVARRVANMLPSLGLLPLSLLPLPFGKPRQLIDLSQHTAPPFLPRFEESMQNSSMSGSVTILTDAAFQIIVAEEVVALRSTVAVGGTVAAV